MIAQTVRSVGSISMFGGSSCSACSLTAEPAFDESGFMVKWLLQRDSTSMIARLQQEVAARAAADGAR
jgi:hypothetical protein